MKISVTNYVNHMPEGGYRGYISAVSASNDNRYLWFKVEILDETAVLNISLPINSFLCQNFSKYFIDENGEAETEEFIGSLIDFSITDKVINGVTYSKFTRLEPVFKEDEENEA